METKVTARVMAGGSVVVTGENLPVGNWLVLTNYNTETGIVLVSEYDIGGALVAERYTYAEVEKEIPLFPLDPSEAEQLQREMNETVERLYAGMGVSRMPKAEESAFIAGVARRHPGMCQFCVGDRSVCSCKQQMLDTIIASQVAAGGVDTEGTRAQAERWCAMLAGCICDGMRATTEQSALRLFVDDGTGRYDGRRAFLNMAGGNPQYSEAARGKPLGRP